MNTQRLIEQFLASRKNRGAPKQSIANNRIALNAFAEHIGNRKLERIGTVDIENFLDRLGHYSPSYQAQILSTVRVFLQWCERRHYVRRNAASGVRGPAQPRTRPRALLGESGERVVDACPDARARFIVVTMLQQGVRCCEVSRLQVADVDRFHKTMHVIGKGGNERLLPLVDETAQALHAYLMEYPAAGGPLVRSYTRPRQPLSPGTISRLVSRWMYDAGIKFGPNDGVSAHANRHTALSDMLLGGAHLRDVQAAAGHRQISTTERYVPPEVNGLRAAMSGRSYGLNRRP